MSYGPQLPPHLAKTSQEDSSDSEEDDQCYGPRLPSVPCRGPQPSSSYGPQIPDSNKDDDDDDEVIGPLPPKPGEEVSAEDAIRQSFEARAQRMKDKLEGRLESGQPKRDSWMLELPEEKAKNFGLGPRQFSRSNNPKSKRDKSWTQTPSDKLKNKDVEVEQEEEDVSQDPEVLEYMANLQRDQEMERVSSELKKKRGDDSLLDLHTKKLKKKHKEEDKPVERRPFDRDVDLQANRFDQAQKEAMIKKAAKLDSRFASGQTKFL